MCFFAQALTFNPCWTDRFARLSTQILGRNLEALVGRAQELKEEMKDDFVSVEASVLGGEIGFGDLCTSLLVCQARALMPRGIRGCCAACRRLGFHPAESMADGFHSSAASAAGVPG